MGLGKGKRAAGFQFYLSRFNFLQGQCIYIHFCGKSADFKEGKGRKKGEKIHFGVE